MASFVQRFALKRKESTGNSIQQEIMLAEMRQAQADLASRISKETSSEGNIEAILSAGSEDISPDSKTEEETLLEQEIENNSVAKLLKAIELATSPEELSSLKQQYEELLSGWSKKISLLRSEKHLKEYLAIEAALSMLQTMQQVNGRLVAERIQQSLKSQSQSIAEQAKHMQVQNQKLYAQQQLLSKQLSTAEQALRAAMEALKKDPGKLSPGELQATLKQMQGSLKQLQALKENAANGKVNDVKSLLENLQKIQAQQQKLIESGKLSETALQAIRMSQQSLQQATQQANIMRQMQEAASRTAREQMRHGPNQQAMQIQANAQLAQQRSNITVLHTAPVVKSNPAEQANKAADMARMAHVAHAANQNMQTARVAQQTAQVQIQQVQQAQQQVQQVQSQQQAQVQQHAQQQVEVSQRVQQQQTQQMQQQPQSQQSTQQQRVEAVTQHTAQQQQASIQAQIAEIAKQPAISGQMQQVAQVQQMQQTVVQSAQANNVVANAAVQQQVAQQESSGQKSFVEMVGKPSSMAEQSNNIDATTQRRMESSTAKSEAITNMLQRNTTTAVARLQARIETQGPTVCSCG